MPFGIANTGPAVGLEIISLHPIDLKADEIPAKGCGSFFYGVFCMATTRKPEKIRSVEVKRLFNRFDHKIEFLDDNDIVILTAPNGHGKTVMLRIVDALFSRRLYFFWKLTFQEIVVTFVTGKKNICV